MRTIVCNFDSETENFVALIELSDVRKDFILKSRKLLKSAPKSLEVISLTVADEPDWILRSDDLLSKITALVEVTDPSAYTIVDCTTSSTDLVLNETNIPTFVECLELIIRRDNFRYRGFCKHTGEVLETPFFAYKEIFTEDF